MKLIQKILKTIAFTVITLAVLLGIAAATVSILGIQLIVRM